MLEILIGQIPEAIYFSLFMIFAKNLKSKRILFTALMVAEYLLLKQFINFNIWFQVIYTFMTFVILKVLYKEKAQVTDIFTFAIGSVVLMIISIVSYFIVWKTVNIYYFALALNRILIILFLILTYNKLYKIQNLYKKFWNRNDKIKKKMKSTTFRALNLVIFNIMFYIINICMIFIIRQNGGV